MRKINLLGELGEKFGESFLFDIKTGAEAIRALIANFPMFEKELIESENRNVGYKVLCDNVEVEQLDDIQNPVSGEISIVPVIMGSSAGARIFIGAALIAAAVVIGVGSGGTAGVVSSMLLSAGVGMILGGVVQLLSPPPKVESSQADDPQNQASYIFNGPVNTSAQGNPVPICYGEMLIGSAIISAGITTEQLQKGFVEKQVVRTADRTATVTEDNLNAPPPDNYYRKELLQYYMIVDVEAWDFRYYYYETILVGA